MIPDYDVAVHNSRVFADSGQVVDNITTNRNVRLLKQANLWDSCVFFGDIARGVKKDSNEYVSKVYDLKANADLAQATGTKQPKYQNDGAVLYDAGDSLLSPELSAGNAVRNTVNNFTLCTTFKKNANSAEAKLLLARDNTISGQRGFYVYFVDNLTGKWYQPNSLGIYLFNSTGVAGMRNKANSTSLILGTKYNVIVDWNGTDISLMINGAIDNGIYNPSVNGTGSILNNITPLSVGGFGNASVEGYKPAAYISKTIIFNRILTIDEKLIVNSILDDWS